jgi:hypothetical protein
MQGNDRDAYDRNHWHRKINEPGQCDHGKPNCPKDDQEHRIRREAYLREHNQAKYRHFKHNQPNTATNQQPQQLAFRVMAAGHPKYAPKPAVSMKTGAQKCVIQRVKKIAGVVRARSVGKNCCALRAI